MKKLLALYIAAIAPALTSCNDNNKNNYLPNDATSVTEAINTVNNAWYDAGQKKVTLTKAHLQKLAEIKDKAKNIILFVGDGMGISTVTAARILEGQNKGMMGEENNLSFDNFPFTGMAKTYNTNAQTPDSAGTMTALVTGVKTNMGVLGVDEDARHGDCASVAGNELITALELAELAGMSTGLVSTARITHATPAATYAKSADRNWEDNSDKPGNTDACEDIALQLINFEKNLESRFDGADVNGIEVVMGGGRRHFLPKDETYNSPDAKSRIEGDRTDNRDLIKEWTAHYTNGKYVFDQTGFDALTDHEEHVLGLFNESHMQYEADRKNDITGEPSLSEMTAKAIAILDNNEKGFFLSVESGRIDHAHHAGNAYNALSDTIEFSKAIQIAYDATDPKETLIIVTADHSHVFTIAGYPKRGNPILGKVVNNQGEEAKDEKGLPYTTLGYLNGRGFRNLGNETDADAVYSTPLNAPSIAAADTENIVELINQDEVTVSITGRIDLSSVDTTTPGFHQEALIPMNTETHAGEDVGVYASGPSAALVSGTNEQNYIFHVMNYAGDLVKKAEEATMKKRLNSRY